MKITAEHVQEMHEAKYSRDTMAVIANTREDEIAVGPETTARQCGWWIITDASRFEDWTGGYALEPGDYQDYADAINRDLDLM